MTREQFAQGWTLLLTAYADAVAKLADSDRQARRDLYARMLRDMDGALWEATVAQVIASREFFPKVSEILEVARGLSAAAGGHRTPEAAFEIARRHVKRLDPFNPNRPMDDPPADIDRVVKELGGWLRFGMIENEQLHWYQKEFIAAYQRLHGAQIIQQIGAGASGLQPALAQPGQRALREGEAQ